MPEDAIADSYICHQQPQKLGEWQGDGILPLTRRGDSIRNCDLRPGWPMLYQTEPHPENEMYSMH
jgi:hypothetical protein